MSDKGPLKQRIRNGWRAFNEIYDGMFFAPYRSAVAREKRDKEEVFMLLCFSDMI